jgi:hypothetical protein
LTYDESTEVKMTPFGVEIIERQGDDAVRVLFPWARVASVTQRGAAVSAIYHY